MNNEKILQILEQRLYNACMRIEYGTVLKKVLYITANTLFIDGLLSVKPTPGKALQLDSEIKLISVTGEFVK